MDAAAAAAEREAAREFLTYLKTAQAEANTAVLAADAMLSRDPENQRLKDALARTIGLLAAADGQVAAQIAAISNPRSASAPAPAPVSSPAARRTPREPSPAPAAKKPKPSLANSARQIVRPEHGFLDSQGKTHVAHLALACALDRRLDLIWALVDGLTAVLRAAGIFAPPPPEVDSVGDAIIAEEEEAALPVAAAIRTALRDIVSALDAPALALLQETLEEGLVLNVTHFHGPACARAYRSTNPFDTLDTDRAKKLAQAVKDTKSAKPHSEEPHRPRERHWQSRDPRPRDRDPPRRSPPREQRRDYNFPRREAPPQRDTPSSVICRRCHKEGHFAKDCKRP